jgi:uncharacterized protein (TIGR02270 family)
VEHNRGQSPPVEPDQVLWDVMEEHLDEAAYACETFEKDLDDATLTLEDVAQGVEARLHAHVDALVIAGDMVAQRLLASEVDTGTEPAHVLAATLALVRGGHAKLASAGLLHPDRSVRQATLRGVVLAGKEPLQAWALDRFREAREPEIRAVLLPIAGERLEPAALLASLQSDHAGLAAAAAHFVSQGEPGVYLSVIEWLLEHDTRAVRQAALLAGLIWGSAPAWKACQTRALGGEDDREQMALFAALASIAQHDRLVALLDQDALRASVLFALGFSGNAALVSVLMEHLESSAPAEAKLAAQAIALITGLDVQDDDFAVQAPEPRDPGILPPVDQDAEAQVALPALEHDDLDADLVPIPEDAMPLPNVAAIRAYWAKSSGSFSRSERYVLGRPVSVSSMVEALSQARMRVRHVLAQALAARTAGQCRLDTRALISDQRARLEALGTHRSRSFARPYAYT